MWGRLYRGRLPVAFRFGKGEEGLVPSAEIACMAERMTAGYSGTPLAKKLGLRDGQAALLIGVPDTFGEIRGFAGFSRVDDALPEDGTCFDYIHVFEAKRVALEGMAGHLLSALKPDGMLWISWPKKAARLPTTITEDVLREILLPTGLVDVKVCSFDAVWSGLKFVIRKELRSAYPFWRSERETRSNAPSASSVTIKSAPSGATITSRRRP